jgi:mono/diheme cytochrome c family protein
LNENQTSWLLVIAGGVVVGLLLVACLGLFLWLVGPPAGVAGRLRFESNGEQIYFTATSQRGTPITADMGAGMGRMRGMGISSMTCASCHGADGRGGPIQMMMRVIDVPDIRYETLTSEDHGNHGEEEHEPYTEETIKRAITEGVEPDGEPLDWPMPRWSISDEDLDDLVDFLKTLE